MTMKSKPAKRPAKKTVKKTKPAGSLCVRFAEMVRSGELELMPEDLVEFMERVGRHFPGTRAQKFVVAVMVTSINNALSWAKARGYKVPMKEVLRAVEA